MKAFRFFGSTVLALGLASIPALAQTQPSQPDSSQQPTQSQPSQASPSTSDSMPQSQSFTGTIVKGSDGYMLQDDTKKTSYKLDDAKQAKKFEGKNVRVTGTLDSASNTIHVTSVQAASTY